MFALKILVLQFSMALIMTLSSVAQNTLATAMGVGARAIAMGGAYSSIANDGTSFSWNVGGVSLCKGNALSGSYTSMSGAIGTPLGNMVWSGYSHATEEFSLSANWVRFQSTDQMINPVLPPEWSDTTVIPKPNVQRTNQFSAQAEDSYTLSVARKNVVVIDWGWSQYELPIEIPAGVQVRYTRMLLGGRPVSALSFDAGFSLRINLRDIFFNDDYPRIAFAWNMKNIGGSTFSWNNGSDYYGYHSTFGMSVMQPFASLSSDAVISYDYSSLDSGFSKLGAEWRYLKYYSVRVGLNRDSFCFGAGADLGFFGIDYSYQLASEHFLGDTHTLSAVFHLEHLFQ